MKQNLFQIVQLLFNTSPRIPKMRGHPEFNNWTQNLIDISELEGLESLQQQLNLLAENSLTDLTPLNHFMATQGQRVPIKTYFQASNIIIQSFKESPDATLILALVTLLGWDKLVGEELVIYPNGKFYHGWEIIPYACAQAFLQTNALEAASAVVEQVYDLLLSVKYGHGQPEYREDLARYRGLAQQIQEKYDDTLCNMAFELRKSCNPSEDNLRSEVGALVWSLGFIPESQFLKSSASTNIQPSLQFIKQIIQKSLDCISTDPLVQYIWLELKDRPIFNIRKHEALFRKIDLKYTQPFGDILGDDPFGILTDWGSEPPSRLYAKTLINWFKGQIDKEQAVEYVLMCHRLFDEYHLSPNKLDSWELTSLRIASLGYLLMNEFNMLPPNANQNEWVETWYYLTDRASIEQKKTSLYPERPETYCKMNFGLFSLIESEFSKLSELSSPITEKLNQVLDTVEKLRTTGISYWLKVLPPIPESEEQTKLNTLLKDEKQLLEYLRGAYFLMLYDLLPRHYDNYSTMDIDVYFKTREDPSYRLEPENGRKQFKELHDELEALFTKMKEVAPKYAKKRLHPQAGLEYIISAINDHATH